MGMSDDEKKRLMISDEEESDSSGQGTAIQFQDFVMTGEAELTPHEKERKLKEHEEKNKTAIIKQKELRDRREQNKSAPTNNSSYQYGAGGASRSSSFAKHPLLGNSQQFDGIDSQINADPQLNEARTNSEKKEELLYQLRLEKQPQLASVPRLIRGS